MKQGEIGFVAQLEIFLQDCAISGDIFVARPDVGPAEHALPERDRLVVGIIGGKLDTGVEILAVVLRVVSRLVAEFDIAAPVPVV